MDIKKWLEDGTKLPVANTAFKREVPTPFIVFFDDMDVSGSDTKNFVADHSVTIEFYNGDIDTDKEEEIEYLLDKKALEYRRTREYIERVGIFVTIYETKYTEKR